jgi:hypothetical protein
VENDLQTLIGRLSGFFGGNNRTPEEKVTDFSSLFGQMVHPNKDFYDPKNNPPQVNLTPAPQEQPAPQPAPVAPIAQPQTPPQVPMAQPDMVPQQQGINLQDLLQGIGQQQQNLIPQPQENNPLQQVMDLVTLLRQFGLQ